MFSHPKPTIATLKVVLGTTSACKLAAAKAAFKAEDKAVTVSGVEVASGVPLQPYGYEETLQGAKNRAEKALAESKDADIVMGIESGLMEDDCDQAVIYCLLRSDGFKEPRIYLTEKVLFDKESIALARERGFDKWTVGMILKERGLVKNDRDPHLSLTGVSRETYLTDTLAVPAVALTGSKPATPRISF